MIDIIIVNYNSTDYLIACLDSVYRDLNKIPARIFVQDNDSNDNIDRVLNVFPRIILHKNKKNIGFSRAANQVLDYTKAPYVLLLNPDTIVQKRFFQTVVAYMEKNPKTGVLGPRIAVPDGSVQESARMFPTPLTGLFGRTTILSRLFPGNCFTQKNLLASKCECNRAMPVDWVSGACMVVRRATIEKVGCLDERFFMYWEDADWCRRIANAGWQVIYHPKPQILHYTGKSSDKNYLKSRYEFHKSAFLLFEKYSHGLQRFFFPVAILALSGRFCIITMFYFFKKTCRYLFATRIVKSIARLVSQF